MFPAFAVVAVKFVNAGQALSGIAPTDPFDVVVPL